MTESVLKHLLAALAWLRKEWYNPLALLLLLGLCIAAIVYVFGDRILSGYGPAAALLVLTSAAGAWYLTTRLPKAPKTQVGFAVALSTETKEHHDKITQDFVATLRELLADSKLQHGFFLVEFPEYYAKKVTTPEEARKYLQKARCHFMVFGRARIRELHGTAHHVLNLRGMVTHAPIGPETGKQFAAEFSELFPSKVYIASENDIFSFDVTSELVSLVARYIIGHASLLSWDIEYAQTLLEDLREKLSSVKSDLPPIVKMRQRVPERLATTYLLKTQMNFKQWRQTHEPDHLHVIETCLNRLQCLSPNSYDGHLLRAIWHFLSNRDIMSAKKEIRKCKDERDSKWRLSQAFLDAYSGKLAHIERKYKAAFRYDCPPVVLLQVEEFITWVVDQEPDKVQLLFCLGLLNLFGKHDGARAAQDFERFVVLAPHDQFRDQIALAKAYIGTITRHVEKDLATEQPISWLMGGPLQS